MRRTAFFLFAFGLSSVAWFGCGHGESCPTGVGGSSAHACVGETYDVNGMSSDGCEVHDAPTDNHVQSHAVRLGTYSACDMDGTVGFDLTGTLPSDDSCHDPAIDGFDPKTGSAPDWIAVTGAGHVFCENDLVANIVLEGTAKPSCYRFFAITDKNQYECDVGANGTCGFNYDSGSEFSDGATIYFEVLKTCGTDVLEHPTYRITGHF